MLPKQYENAKGAAAADTVNHHHAAVQGSRNNLHLLLNIRTESRGLDDVSLRK
jgi:hypothetical protein